MKDQKLKILFILSLIIILMVVFGASQHAAKGYVKEKLLIPDINGRAIGRYADTALPIIIILGLISYFIHKKNNSNKLFLASIMPILVSSQLLLFTLLPVNNISLSIIGTIRYIVKAFTNQTIAIIIGTILILIFSATICWLYGNSKKLVSIITLIFILTNINSLAITSYSSSILENHPQLELSKWISKNIPKDSRIIIDEEYCGIFSKENIDIICNKSRSLTLIGLWIMNPIYIQKINEGEYEYIITKSKLDLELIQKTENDIYLYRTKKI